MYYASVCAIEVNECVTGYLGYCICVVIIILYSAGDSEGRGGRKEGVERGETRGGRRGKGEEGEGVRGGKRRRSCPICFTSGCFSTLSQSLVQRTRISRSLVLGMHAN